MAFCSNCGQQMLDDANFCPNCGKSRQARGFQYPTYASSPPRRDSNLPLVLIAIVAVVVVIIPIILMIFMIPVITENASSHAIKYTSDDFYNSSSGTLILNESDMGSEWTNTSDPSDVRSPGGYILDYYRASFNKSSNGGWINVTIYVYRYDAIYDARDDHWHNKIVASSVADLKDEDIGDVSYFWTNNNLTYSLAFVKGNVIVGVKLVDGSSHSIDGEEMIKEIANKQADKITS
ncbi:MAG: zinc ribbon domain-containing protein [Methanomassiliicoccus sp.]|nr:zinc ribbon domain-containing protein [Methanomassiliicoccus sp.]